MADSRFNPPVDQTRQEIQRLLAELDDLAEQNVSAERFHREMLQRAHAVLDFRSAAVWLAQPAGPAGLAEAAALDSAESAPLQLFGEWNLADAGVHDDPALRKGHDALLQQALRAGQATSTSATASNPTESLLLFAPIYVEGRAAGVLESFHGLDERASAVPGRLRFLSRLADSAGRALRNRQYRELARQAGIWNELDGFLRSVHSARSSTHAAYLIANDGRRLIGCERVSVATRRGKGVRVRAVSGQETVARKSNLVRTMAQLVRAVLKTREPLVYTGLESADPPPGVKLALERYLKESHSRLLVIRPLEDPGRPPGKLHPPEGALVVEMVEDAMEPAELAGRVELIARHGGQALFKAIDEEKVFLRPVARGLGRALHGGTSTQTRQWTLAAAVGAAVVWTLMYVPWPLRIEGKGELVPKVHQAIYAPVSGVVVDVLVDHDTVVEPQTEVVTLSNPTLNQELLKLQGELEARRRAAKTQREVRDASTRPRGRTDAEPTTSRLSEVESEIVHLEHQIKALQGQMSSLHLTAPIAGAVLDWKPREKLYRPVQQGEELLDIGQVEREWVVEVQFPEKAVSHVARALLDRTERTLPATILLSSDPKRVLTGKLVQLSTQAQLVEKDNVVRARVVLDEPLAAADRRSGLEVRVKVDCGPHALGYVLFRELIDFVRSWIFF